MFFKSQVIRVFGFTRRINTIDLRRLLSRYYTSTLRMYFYIIKMTYPARLEGLTIIVNHN